ncbi:MAG: hypothetical protein J7M12_00885, partial [Candidatus Hydrogenedentes bacterium]|nr:hypothetical protein [Candidatus Hydrogenedentota bacterium]
MRCTTGKYASEELVADLCKHAHESTDNFAKINRADIVVGIPFYNEADTIGNVVELAVAGLKEYYPDKTGVILCVGSPAGAKALDALKSIEKDYEGDTEIYSFLLKRREHNGRGWSIRAMMELAVELHAHLVLLSADLLPRTGSGHKAGFGPDWIWNLLEPIMADEIDFVIPRHIYHCYDVPVQTHLVYPLIASVFGTRIRQPIAGEYGISYKMLRSCIRNGEKWREDAGTYGFDPWLTTTALVNELPMCEVGMGSKFHKPNPGKLKMMFSQTVSALFEQITRHDSWWRRQSRILKNIDTFGAKEDAVPQRISMRIPELITHFRRDFNQYHQPLLKSILPVDICSHLENLTDSSPSTFYFSAAEWARSVNAMLRAYAFAKDFDKCDVIDALYPVFIARLASFVREIEELKGCLETLPAERADRILRGEAERKIDVQTDYFIRFRPEFMRRWEASEIEQTPYLPQLGSWEFVPNVGVVLPQEIKTESGDTVFARDIYRALLDRYREEFKAFVHNKLNVPEDASSEMILAAIRQNFLTIERCLDRDILPGSLHTLDGLQRVTNAVMQKFPHGKAFCLKDEVAYRLIRRHVPRNLVTILPCTDLAGLLDMYDARDALALSSWTEDMEYKEQIWHALLRCKPDDFERVHVKPLVVDHARFETIANVAEASGLNRIAGRIIVGTLPKGKGGDFPKLRYFLSIGRNLVEAEVFGDIWAEFAAEEVDFAERLVASKRGHWGRRILSAHNMFENGIQRVMAERIRSMAQSMDENTKSLILGMADSYHLSITLADARFVPCSAWTWASYSFKGGQGYPTPLSVLVERDWATRDFIVQYMEAAGIGNEETLRATIVRLMGEGQESVDIRKHLFDMSGEAIETPVQQTQKTRYTTAGKMWRPVDGPILEPIEDHEWESQYVLNCAVVRVDGTIFILYRAFGEDKISRLGLAWTKDGIHIDGRLDSPVFGPQTEYESRGTEDPRITVFGDTLYMLYTAYDGDVAQIALASISKDEFLARDWSAWKRWGLCFPGVYNKDAVLYPEKINGKFALYHRIDPNMWISYAETLECPWPRTGHRIVIGPRPGMMWDSIKVGAGAPPIKTDFGWLNIYHGVDYLRYYRLGVVLVDLDDPSELLYQSPNPVLEPEADFEVGKG